MNTEDFIKNLKENSYLYITKNNIELSDMKYGGVISWNDRDWHYGVYTRINDMETDGVYAIPYVICDEDRIYGWVEKDRIEENLYLDHESTLATIIVADSKQKFIRMKLKI